MNLPQVHLLCASLSLSGILLGQSYSVIDLGGGNANDINNNGQIVGDSNGYGFYWDGTNKTSITRFRVGDLNYTASRGSAVAITDTGYIAGTMNVGDFLTFGCIFRGATNSAIQIPFTTGADNAGNLLGIADPTGGMVVGLLPPTRGHYLQLQSPLSRFYAINSHGVIAGSAAAVTDDSLDTTADPPRACYFTNSTVVYIDTRAVPAVRRPWTLVDDSRFRMSDALAINDSGMAAGWFRSEDQGPTRAFSYAGSGMVDLGTLGGSNSVARDINASGVIVGESNVGDGSTHAFIYVSGTMQDLNTYAPVSGWEFLTANAINDHGEIVGQARHDGQLKAYLLKSTANTPPPAITQQPLSARVAEGEPWTLSAGVTAVNPLSLQWQHESTNIPTATNLTFRIAAVTPASVGSYRIVASNLGGTTISSNAVVEIRPATNYYEITDLGLGIANDLNNSGQVVASSNDGGGFFYNGIESFGFGTPILAINDSGQIASVFQGYNTSGGVEENGLVWASFVTQVTGIDTDGVAIGWSFGGGATPTAGIGWSRLAFNLNVFAQFYDINRSNIIVGVAGAQSQAFRDFRTQRGRACIISNNVVTYIDPRPLPEDYLDNSLNAMVENHLSDAYGINDSGVVVGVMSMSLGGHRHAFRYTGSGLQDLGTLGGTNSAAREINASGVIVGESLTGDGKTHAFIYRDGAMTDLNSFLPPNSGMELISATAINDRSQIVGQAMYGGALHAYILSPPGLANAPAISTPPVGGRLSLGQNLTLSVTATGTIPFTYQWTLNGTNIANATNSTYAISSASAADAGEYRVLITNAGGTTPSVAVRIDVLDPELAAVNYIGLDIAGAVGATYRIEFKASADALAWTTLTNLTLTSSPQAWIDPNSRNHPSRIYRATRIP
jgi:probable HAF family extracellular repeat protein